MAAAGHLHGFTEDRGLDEALDLFDEDYVHVWVIALGGERYDWVQGYLGDTEVGVGFEAGTTRIVAEISDGELLGCMAR